jgi:AcrR family transcriptional regulator
MDGFARRVEKKKDSIKRAALGLFKVHGFEKVSMNDIAKKACVSKVTIYKHFGSKDELINIVVKEIFMSISEELRTVIRGNMPFPEKLEFVIFRKTETATEYSRELIRMIDQEHHFELKQFIHTLWQEEVNQLVLELFEEGRRMGYVDKGLSSEVIQTYFGLLREGAFASTGLLEKKLQNAQGVRDLVYVILHGLMAKRE